MSAPATADWSALLRLAQYLVLQPRAVYGFPWQDDGGCGTHVRGHRLCWALPRSAIHVRGGSARA
eukprot:14110665-Alexandrium_andersonii.AAC.1